MASFLDTHAIANALNQVITKAEKDILLITPYVSFPTMLFQRLQDADERGVNTTMVFGKQMIKQKEVNKLAELEHLSLYFLENLHAKCYANEHLMVVSSMNLYDYSEKNNREMGVQIKFKEDPEMYKDGIQECESIIKASEVLHERRPKNQKYQKASTTGHCLRCNASINLNTSAPYCRDCYTSWSSYKNWDYREKHCHVCGNQATTSMNMPVCKRC